MSLKRPLLAALLLLALAGGARAEQVTITGNGASPLTTTDGTLSVPRTTQQTFGPGFSVTGANGAAVIGFGPLPTTCGGAGAVDGAAYNRNGTVAICSATALTWGGTPLTWGGISITGL